MSHTKPAPENDRDHQASDARSENSRDSPMKARLLDTLEEGTDIGHSGRPVFAMVARDFLDDEEMIRLLASQLGQDETQARALLMQVKERDYNPPKRERILLWQEQQEFQICPWTDDPNSGNVYRELRFPDGIYDHLNEFWEERAQGEEEQAGHWPSRSK